MSDERHPFRRQLLRNTATTGLGNVWAIVVGLASLPLLLRGLGPTALGHWVLLQTFSATTGWLSLADLGADVATARAVASRAAVDDDEGVATTVGAALALFALLGLAGAVVVATVGVPLLPALVDTPASARSAFRLAILVFAGQVVLEFVMRGVQACLEGLQRVDLSRVIDAARRTFVAVLTVAAALSERGLEGVAVASLVGTGGGTLVAIALFARHRKPGRLRVDRGEVRALLAYGRKVFVLKSSGVLHRTMDRLIVGVLLGPARVVTVEIATQGQNAASAILAASSYTALSSAPWLRAREAEEKVRDLLVRGTKLSLLVTLPVVIAGMELAGPFVRLWIGDEYGHLSGVVALAILYVGLAAPLTVGSNLLQGVGQAGVVARFAAIAAVVNLGLSVVLVHAFGVAGAFVATIVSAALLSPPLARAVAAETGMTVGGFLRAAVVPLALPASVLAVVVGAAVLAPLGDFPTVVIGLLGGGLAYVAATFRWTMGRHELRELFRTAVGEG